jgi:hypothetical protein
MYVYVARWWKLLSGYYMHAGAYAGTHMYVYMYVCIYVCIHDDVVVSTTCMLERSLAHICICVCVYMYVFIRDDVVEALVSVLHACGAY